jgi:hypothetical protein
VEPDVDRDRVVAGPGRAHLRLHVARGEHREVGVGKDAHHLVANCLHQPPLVAREHAVDDLEASVDDIAGCGIAELLVEAGAVADVSEHHRHGPRLSCHAARLYRA